ncbi:PIN domain-containing protein [Hymenobacter sp. BT664]|uniref:PIN domain-containing protein n=1 Tax=Hymenobacter montanus TaxID=2771359 RepID=A0A927GL48_9BACT|nr:PIN domain-containing protein [Hymenobacter montanus]MBD2769824.1 PIN domain-containing protein [Hymenobacter montanus]
MIHSSRFVAVLDACVLYPAPIRDLLLHLASLGLYTPKWTEIIHDEWMRNLLLNRQDLTAEQLRKTKDAMCGAFPDADVVNFEPLIEALELPDPDDRHLLAAAIRCQADVIVTANLKDFPAIALASYDVEAQHPDAFISNLIDLNPEKALEAFRTQVAFLKNPPRTAAQILDNFRKVEMPVTADKLATLL